MSYAKIRSTVLGAVVALGLITVSSSFGQQEAPGPALNPSHPESYVVQSGDTLWDIAAMFLQDPWYWPEIWQINPQVENPHLIFPGDTLSLSYLDDGRPAVSATRSSAPAAGPIEAGPTERLAPAIRTESIENAIPTVPYGTVRAFLSRPAVLGADDVASLPYLFAIPSGLISSAGREVYVRGTDAPVGSVFNLVHPGDALVDPDNGEVIGYQGLYVGQGRVREAGDPATVFLTETVREASIGDYLISEESLTPVNFFPSAPVDLVEGSIMSVLDGVSVVGQYQVIVVNRGARDGIEPGHVLSVYAAGNVVTDEVRVTSFSAEKVQLPDRLSATTMVFRVFDRMSYALVMEATREIRVYDKVRNPQS
jgi:LysM repeat protein